MLKIVTLLILTLVSVAYQNDVDIDALIASMTPEEKCGQMTQITFDVFAKGGANRPEGQSDDDMPIDIDKLKEAVHKYKIGSMLNTAYNRATKKTVWQEIIKIIQEEAAKANTSIPIMFGLDSIHGAGYIQEATLFPQPLGMAASFNIDIARKVGEITAMETKAIGVPWNFNPVFDLGRNPLWPRIWETYGEDGFVSAQMGVAYIEGSQGKGDEIKSGTKVVTCLKHYIGYSTPLNGRDRSSTWIPEIILREFFLPPFAAGVAAGAHTVMINSGDVNGIPGHANKHYITDILKGELGFTGFTVSDWQDVIRLFTRDKVAATAEEAVKISVMAGLDMSMVPSDYSFHEHCVSLSKDPEFMARIDDANKRILSVKKLAGLFENALPDPANLENINTENSKIFNLDAARESVVLVKNTGDVLPFTKYDSKSVLVAGPSGNILRTLNGGWSYTWQGDKEEYYENFGDKKYTIYESIGKRGKSNSLDVKFSEGANFTHVTNLNETVVAAHSVDWIVLCIGEDTYTETPGNIDDLSLSKSQIQLANALYETNKPIILVYLGGRPRIITQLVDQVKAVLIAFLPGNRGGEAIADIIFGDYNPSGKLPITYPRNVNGQTNYDLRPIDQFEMNKKEELYPFGFGLSYTSFKYSDLRLSSNSIDRNDRLDVTFKIKNTGNRIGQEVAILYLNDHVATISRPIKQVKGFKKVTLDSNEEQTVKFSLSYEDLTFINADLVRVAEIGDFTVYVDELHADFTLKSEPIVTTNTTTIRPVTTATNRPTMASTTPNNAATLFLSKCILFVAFVFNVIRI